MLSFARVLIILAGVFALPSVACSGMCSSALHETDASDSGKALWSFFAWASLIASIGSIFVGAKAKSLGKTTSGVLCLVFAGVYALQLLQFNVLGVFSAFLLLLGAIMVFVSPAEQFRGVTLVELHRPPLPDRADVGQR